VECREVAVDKKTCRVMTIDAAYKVRCLVGIDRFAALVAFAD
jgi:hypothetical protein